MNSFRMQNERLRHVAAQATAIDRIEAATPSDREKILGHYNVSVGGFKS
jgi:hypothetical protein